jgi:hypothetical protein
LTDIAIAELTSQADKDKKGDKEKQGSSGCWHPVTCDLFAKMAPKRGAEDDATATAAASKKKLHEQQQDPYRSALLLCALQAVLLLSCSVVKLLPLLSAFSSLHRRPAFTDAEL